MSLILISAAAAGGCTASSHIGVQPGGDGGANGTGGRGTGGVETAAGGSGGRLVATGGSGGGTPSDGAAGETGACSCSGGGIDSEPLSTTLDCYCGVQSCHRSIDDALGDIPPTSFYCAAVRHYAGCSLTVVATRIGLDPVNLQVYDSGLGALVGVSTGSDTRISLPVRRDQAGTGNWLRGGHPAWRLRDDRLRTDTDGLARSPHRRWRVPRRMPGAATTVVRTAATARMFWTAQDPSP